MKLGPIFLAMISLLTSAPVMAQAAEPAPASAGMIFYNHGHSRRNFVELNLGDLVDEALGETLKPDQVVAIDINGTEMVLTAGELLDKLNAIEKRLSEVGASLRDASTNLKITAVPNPDVWLRELRREVGFSLDSVTKNYQFGLSSCPELSIASLGVNPLNGQPWAGDDLIALDGQKKIKIKDLVPRLNNEQKDLCQLGLSLLDGAVPGTADYLAQLLAKRVDILAQLEVSPGSALYEVASWAKTIDLAEVHQQFEELKAAAQDPSPQRLYHLAQKASKQLPPELAIPDLPTIPAPHVAKRTDLRLKKRYDWPGFNIGSRDIAGAYAGAWAELRSGRAAEAADAPTNEQALQGEANVGLYLLNEEVNLLGATLDSQMNPANAYATVKTCYLGVCKNRTAGIQDFGIKEGDPELLAKNWEKAYSQQLMVGIVPVVIRAGGRFSAKLGWSLGMNLLAVQGGLDGLVSASAIGEAAVGIQDFVEAGCGGEITIVRDQIKINGNAEVKFYGDGQPLIKASLVGDNSLDSLDGRIYAYALLDALGPLGEYLDAVIDTLKQLGDGTLEDFVRRLGNGSELANKLVHGLEGAGRSIAKEWQKGADAVGKVFSGCCKKPKWSATPSLAHAMPFGGLSVNGTKVRYEQDWFSFHGSHSDKRFLNYIVTIGPDGKEYGGDAVAGDDSIAENITLAQREASLAAAEVEAQALANAVLRDSYAFFAQEATAIMTGLPHALSEQAASQREREQEVFSQFGGAL